jgi:hypothetical protein
LGKHTKEATLDKILVLEHKELLIVSIAGVSVGFHVTKVLFNGVFGEDGDLLGYFGGEVSGGHAAGYEDGIKMRNAIDGGTL